MKTNFSEIRRLPEFEKDFKKLLKRFTTLNEDIQTFIDNQLILTHKRGIDNKGVFHISDLGIETPKIFKEHNIHTGLVDDGTFDCSLTIQGTIGGRLIFNLSTNGFKNKALSFLMNNK